MVSLENPPMKEWFQNPWVATTIQDFKRTMDTNSILETVKKGIGIEPDYTHFDPDIISAINATFVVLNSLGIGPEEPYLIEDKYNTWDEFTGPGVTELVKTDVILRTRLLFDPPSASYLVDNIKEQIREFEFRMLIKADEESEDSDE